MADKKLSHAQLRGLRVAAQGGISRDPKQQWSQLGVAGTVAALCIAALQRKKFVDENLKITDEGREALAQADAAVEADSSEKQATA